MELARWSGRMVEARPFALTVAAGLALTAYVDQRIGPSGERDDAHGPTPDAAAAT